QQQRRRVMSPRVRGTEKRGQHGRYRHRRERHAFVKKFLLFFEALILTQPFRSSPSSPVRVAPALRPADQLHRMVNDRVDPPHLSTGEQKMLGHRTPPTP